MSWSDRKLKKKHQGQGFGRFDCVDQSEGPYRIALAYIVNDRLSVAMLEIVGKHSSRLFLFGYIHEINNAIHCIYWVNWMYLYTFRWNFWVVYFIFALDFPFVELHILSWYVFFNWEFSFVVCDMNVTLLMFFYT